LYEEESRAHQGEGGLKEQLLQVTVVAKHLRMVKKADNIVCDIIKIKYL